MDAHCRRRFRHDQLYRVSHPSRLLNLPNEIVLAIARRLNVSALWRLASTCLAMSDVVRSLVVSRFEGAPGLSLATCVSAEAPALRAFLGIAHPSDPHIEPARATEAIKRAVAALGRRMGGAAWPVLNAVDRCGTCARAAALRALREDESRRRAAEARKIQPLGCAPMPDDVIAFASAIVPVDPAAADDLAKSVISTRKRNVPRRASNARHSARTSTQPNIGLAAAGGAAPSLSASALPPPPRPPFMDLEQDALDGIIDYARATCECNAHSAWHERVRNVTRVVHDAIAVWFVRRRLLDNAAIVDSDDDNCVNTTGENDTSGNGADACPAQTSHVAAAFWVPRPRLETQGSSLPASPSPKAHTLPPLVVNTPSGHRVSSLVADIIAVLDAAAESCTSGRLAVWVVAQTIAQTYDSRRFLVAADPAVPRCARDRERRVYYRAGDESHGEDDRVLVWSRAHAGKAQHVERATDMHTYLAAANGQPSVLWPRNRPRPLFATAPRVATDPRAPLPARDAANEHWAPVRWFVSRRTADGRNAAAAAPHFVVVLDPSRGITPVAVECSEAAIGDRVVLAHVVRLPPASLLGRDAVRVHALLARLCGVVSRLMGAVGNEWARCETPIERPYTEAPADVDPACVPLFEHAPPRPFHARTLHYVGAILQDSPFGAPASIARALAARSRDVRRVSASALPSSADMLPYMSAPPHAMFEAPQALPRAKKMKKQRNSGYGSNGNRARVSRRFARENVVRASADPPTLRSSVVCRWPANAGNVCCASARPNVGVCMLDADAYAGAKTGDMAYHARTPWLPLRVGAFAVRGGFSLAQAMQHSRAAAEASMAADVARDGLLQWPAGLPPAYRSARQRLALVSPRPDGPDAFELAQRMRDLLVHVADAHTRAFDSVFSLIVSEAGASSSEAAALRAACGGPCPSNGSLFLVPHAARSLVDYMRRTATQLVSTRANDSQSATALAGQTRRHIGGANLTRKRLAMWADACSESEPSDGPDDRDAHVRTRTRKRPRRGRTIDNRDGGNYSLTDKDDDDDYDVYRDRTSRPSASRPERTSPVGKNKRKRECYHTKTERVRDLLGAPNLARIEHAKTSRRTMSGHERANKKQRA